MELKYYDTERLKSFLIRLYGAQAKTWPMNEKIFNLTYGLVSSSAACSGSMALVPMPVNPFSNALKSIGKQAAKKFIKALNDDESHYVICLKAAAYKSLTAFQLAAQGL